MTSVSYCSERSIKSDLSLILIVVNLEEFGILKFSLARVSSICYFYSRALFELWLFYSFFEVY